MAKFFHLFCIAIGLLTSCTHPPKQTVALAETASIFPEVDGVCCPPNMGFPSFRILDSTSSAFFVNIIGANNDIISLKTKDVVTVKSTDWQAFANRNQGQTITLQIHRKRGKIWETHPDFHFKIAEEPIDRYVWYRLIEPLYDVWRDMGIYQYDLQTLSQREILSTNHTQHSTSCMNCHTFANHDANTMLFHLRKSPKGTLLLKNDTFSLIDNQNPNFNGLYAYASWHPKKNHVAFAIPDIYAAFTTSRKQLMHVYDFSSSIGVMNIEKQTFITNETLNDSNYLATFPSFHPSGNELYFCRGKKPVYDRNNPMKTLVPNTFYNIVKIRFDAQTDRLSTAVEPVVTLDSIPKSALFPRLSPDGRYMLYTVADYGGFPIWHNEADLWLLDMQNGANRRLDEINSDCTESYHSWSSNGRWIIFSSRRMNGLYTRLYIAYFNTDGTFSKPLLLQQKTPDFYRTFTKSYNIPEFTKNPYSKTPEDILKAAQTSAVSLKTKNQ